MEETNYWKRGVIIGGVTLFIALFAFTVIHYATTKTPIGRGIKATNKDVAKAISLFGPIRSVEIWEDEPTRCRNWRNCKSTKFTGSEQGNGSWLWQCQSCKTMWLYPYKARILVGITDTEITFTPLPAARQVLPAPPPDAKVEPEKKKGR